MVKTPKYINSLPLAKLWADTEYLSFTKIRGLSKQEGEQLLLTQKTPVVIAGIGAPLIWLDEQQIIRFWQNDLQFHFADHDKDYSLSNFDGNYLYWVSEWRNQSGESVIVAEKAH